ncbi:MAG: LamG domain-containing protein [Caldilineaceae bacterium]
MINFSGNAMTLHGQQSDMYQEQRSLAVAGTYSVSSAPLHGLLDSAQPLRRRLGGHDGNRAAGLLHLDEDNAAIAEWDNVGGVNAPATAALPRSRRRGKVSQAAGFDELRGLSIPDSAALDLDNHTRGLDQSGVGEQKGGGQPIIAKSDGDYRNYAIYFNLNTEIYLTRHCTEGDLIELFSEATLPLDQFTHVAATYDGAYLALYINGVLDNSEQVQSRNACHNDAPLTIGAPYNANTHYRFFNGVLDEVLVYADALWDYPDSGSLRSPGQAGS